MWNALKKPQVYVPILAVLLVVLLGVAGYFIFRSWLVALIVALALALIGLMVALLRTVLVQEKEARLDRGIGEPDEVAPVTTSGGSTMQENFRRAVDDIRSSRLGTHGIDAMPWILVLGEPGAGKTAAVRESGLELPAEYARRIGAGPTQECDWWLTNQAIVLDLAGRFLQSEDDETRGSWSSLLRGLRRQRPECGLSGLVFAVSVTSLLGKSAAELEELALALRRRINEATDALGVDLPVYVMVTQCDRLEGFVETAGLLPPGQLGESLGWTNDRRIAPDTEKLALDGLDAMLVRLEGMLCELVLRDPDRVRRRRIFTFPQELDSAVHAVASLVGRAFAASSYAEAPFLRGIYFTSAQREGATISPLLHRLGWDSMRNSVDGSMAAGGTFLRDVFREIIIGDQNLALPISRYGPRTRRIAHLGAGFCFALLAGWWLIAFTGNLIGIRGLKNEAASVRAGASSLSVLEALRSEIAEQDAGISVLRRGGLGGSIETALERARTTFAWAFGNEFAAPTKLKLKGVVRGFDDRAFEALAQLAQDVTWLGGRADETASARPDLTPWAPISKNETEMTAFRNGYDDFVRWSRDDELRILIDDEREVVASGSGRLLELRRLESWSESSASGYLPATYADVDLPGAAESTTHVPGAYTARGWNGLVSGLIDAIDRTSGVTSTVVNEFRRGYITRFDDNWRVYLLETPLPPRDNSDVLDSPYIALIEQIHSNTLAELPRDHGLPPFIAAVRELRREEPLEQEEPKEGEKEPEPPPIPPWKQYRAALEQVAADVAKAEEEGKGALDLAIRMAERQATSFGKALQIVDSLVSTEGDPTAAAKLRELLSMPILDGASAVLGRALDELDRRWADRIARPFGGDLNAGEMKSLYAAGGGKLKAFRAEALKHFYSDGRATAVIGNRGMPLGPRFRRWMKTAEKVQRSLYPGGGPTPRISARLEGVPSIIHGGSSLLVSKREIRLACDEQVQTFRYLGEGTGSYAFKWTPDCVELSLRIWVLDTNNREVELRPRHEWTGPMAFPGFLQQAQRQKGRRFLWNLRYDEPKVEITMVYRLSGGDEILSIAHSSPPGSMRN
jgi:hypothetical protein